MNPSIFGLRQLLGAVGDLMLAFDKTLDYHVIIELVSPVVIGKILKSIEILNNFSIDHS